MNDKCCSPLEKPPRVSSTTADAGLSALARSFKMFVQEVVQEIVQKSFKRFPEESVVLVGVF